MKKGVLNTISRELEVGEGPVAAFSANRWKGVPPFEVQFTNESAGGESYRWSFGDAQQSGSSEEHPVFAFTEVGEYEVQLITFNAEKCADTVKHRISVVEPKYDVVLKGVNLLQENGQMQLVLSLENAGTIRVTEMEVEVLINNEYALSEKFAGELEIGQQENYVLHTKLLENSRHKVRFVCVKLKPVPELEIKELSLANNEKCLSFDQAFVMQEPYPNPSNGKVTFEFMLPEPGTVSMYLYSAQGKLVRQMDLKDRPAGLNVLEVYLDGMGNGIYFVLARFGGEVVSHRLMKE